MVKQFPVYLRLIALLFPIFYSKVTTLLRCAQGVRPSVTQVQTVERWPKQLRRFQIAAVTDKLDT